MEYDARYIMGEDAMDLFVVPKENWWKKMRESMGMESWVYGMLEICKADAILQFGFDETAIDLQSTMNMWALIKQKDKLRVVAVQVGAILPCGTASGGAGHLAAGSTLG